LEKAIIAKKSKTYNPTPVQHDSEEDNGIMGFFSQLFNNKPKTKILDIRGIIAQQV
jgi:hypothetical protein